MSSIESSLQSPFQEVAGSKVGYLVVGHGTRSRAGQDQVRAVFEQMKLLDGPTSLRGLPSELAFLELAEPDIPTAVERLSQVGVTQLVVVPVLLFSAGHAQHDIPEAVEAAACRFGMQVLQQSSSICLDPTIVELSAERFHQALKLHGVTGNLEDVALAMIGRGSNSEAATDAMRDLVEMRVAATSVGWSSVGFIHAQRPTVDEALDALAATGLQWLVVQPHLLFEGELVDDLRREVAYRQSFSDSQKWIVTETLGSSPDDQRLAATLCRLAIQSVSQSSASQSSASQPSSFASESETCLRCGSPNKWCRIARPTAQVS